MLVRIFYLLLTLIVSMASYRPRQNHGLRVINRMPSDQSRTPSPAPPAAPRPRPARGLTYSDGLKLVIVLVVLLVLSQFLGWILTRVRDVLIIVFLAAILAVSLRPTVEVLYRSKIPFLHFRFPRVFWVLMIYLFLLTLAGIFAVLVVPQIIIEGQDLINALPRLAAYVNDVWGTLFQGRTLPPVASLGNNPEQIIGNFFTYAFTLVIFIIGVIGSIFSFVLILVLALLMIIGADDIIAYFVNILPEDRHEQAYALLAEMGDKIAGWAKGTLMLCAFIGGAATVGLVILDMPYAFILGAFAALAELIPFVGPWLGAAPAVILALFQPTWKLIAVILLYFAIQEIEAHVLAPMVLGRHVGIPALVVIIALVTGAALAGIVGALIAVPVAAILQVLINDLIIPEIKKAQRQPEE